MGTVIDRLLLVRSLVLAGLAEKILGIVLVPLYEVGVALLEIVFSKVVVLDGAFVNFVKVVKRAFVIFLEKIVAGEVEPCIGHTAVNGVFADEVLEQECCVAVVQLRGTNPLVEIGIRFQVVLLVGRSLVNVLEVLLRRSVLSFLEKFGGRFVFVMGRIIRHRPLCVHRHCEC